MFWSLPRKNRNRLIRVLLDSPTSDSTVHHPATTALLSRSTHHDGRTPTREEPQLNTHWKLGRSRHLHPNHDKERGCANYARLTADIQTAWGTHPTTRMMEPTAQLLVMEPPTQAPINGRGHELPDLARGGWWDGALPHVDTWYIQGICHEAHAFTLRHMHHASEGCMWR